MKRLLAILIATALLGLVPAAQAEAKTFKNCTDLRKTYKYGVSLNKAAVNRGPGPIFTPRVNAAVYRLNKKMDLDRDNIICEVVRPKPRPVATPAPVPTPIPTPTPIPPTTARSRPAGTAATASAPPSARSATTCK
jgi:predicted secreted Zn-dependent protease